MRRKAIRALMLWGALWGAVAAARAQSCEKLVLTGAVEAGAAWQQPIGGGWQLRLVPVVPGKESYTGWDLVVDRLPATGYPDALLLATPPYLSMNEREIGTTYGLRAQDAIGWNPRSFRFLVDAKQFAEARGLFLRYSPEWRAGRHSAASDAAAARLMALSQRAASGQFEILDARLVEGTGDAALYARNWALQAARTAHESEKGAPTPHGALRALRFRWTLWLPAGWPLPPGVHGTLTECSM